MTRCQPAPGPETVADRVEQRMGKAARTATAYVQPVYGPPVADEAIQADPLDVSQMAHEQRDALRRRS
jgi:hypothetical protein